MVSRLSNSAACSGVALLVALGLAWPSPALAQAESNDASATLPASEPNAAGVRADDLLHQGVELRRQGDELEALEKFREADALFPSARAKAQCGLVEKSLRDYADAERSLEAALERSDDPWIVEHRALLEEARDFVARHLGGLLVTLDVEQGSLRLPNGERAALPLPKPLRLMAGEIELIVESPGYPTRRVRVEIVPQRTSRLSVRLRQPGELPASAQPAPPPRSQPVPRASNWRRVATYTTGGVTVAATALGSYFAARTFSLKQQRDGICPTARCPTAHGVELDQQARTAAADATVFFAVAGAGLVGVTIVLLSDRHSPQPSKAHASSALSVAVAPSSGGSLVQVSWTM